MKASKRHGVFGKFHWSVVLQNGDKVSEGSHREILGNPSQAQKGSTLADVQLPLDGTQAGGYYLGLLTSAGDNCPVSHRLQIPSGLKLQSPASSHTF